MKSVDVLNCGVLIAKVFEDETVKWAFDNESVRIGYTPVVENVKNHFDDYLGKETLIPNPLFTVVKG